LSLSSPNEGSAYAGVVLCPSCATANPDGAKFCSECGARLVPDGRGSERKIITALFCDLVGSTQLGESLDPEELDGLLRSYHALSRARIEEHGGVVEKFIGDAVVGLFGVPIAHEDDPSRAVAAAYAIVEDLRTAELGLEVRVGINTGEAFVHPGVDPGSGEGLATGDCMNTAARLQSLAPPMGIVVSERARSGARSFAFERLRDATVKGKSKPQLLWQVVGTSGPTSGGHETTPFVGRDSELARLGEAVDNLRFGNGRVIVIQGEPGVGKSRLARKLRADSAGPRWLLGRCVETRDTSGYRPFGQQIRAWVDADLPDWEELGRRASELGVDTGDIPFLAALADVEPPARVAEQVSALPADVVRTSIYRATRAWLDALARAGPVILQFEDWHWADGASVQLLDHVLPLVTSRRILVLLLTRHSSTAPADTTRSAVAADASEQPTIVSLEPLADRDASAILHAVAGDRLTEDQLNAARTRAEGNPYYLQELARYIEEQGDVGGVLPDTVRGVVASRVDSLDEELREVLRAASVIGRAFSLDLLDIAGDPRVDLDRLVATGLVERVDREQGAYRFAHALTREAVYEGIPMSRRREMHRAIAHMLRDRGGERASLPAIAYHLAESEDWEDASTTLLAAGEEAARLASDDDALEMYEAAIRAHERLPKDRWTPLERATIDRQVAEALVRLGRHEEATRQVTGALAALGVRVTESRTAVRRATLRQLLPRIVKPPKLPTLQASPDPKEQEIARELELIGWITYYADADRYALVTMMLTNRAARAGLLEGVGVGAWRCAIAFGALGRRKLAYRYMQTALEAADLMSDAIEVARLKQGLAIVSFGFGTWDEARAQAQLGMDLGGAVGDLRSWGTGCGVLTWAAINHGDSESARSRAQELAHAGADGGDQQIHGFGLATVGMADLYRGVPESAITSLRKAIDVQLQVPDYISAVATNGFLAMAFLRTGDVAGARDAIAWGRREASVRGFRGFMLSSLFEAESELSMHDLAVARNRRTAAASARAVRRSRRHGKVCRWHLVHAHVMDGCRSWLLGRHGGALRAWARGSDLANRLDYPGVAATGHDWVVRCCTTAGIEPPAESLQRGGSKTV
jgi:class 3 adenylate cyclase